MPVKRIVFVDDEENVLSGLRRILRNQVREWEMFFSTSPQEILTALDNGETYDVIVSDMQMPEMSGSEFLRQVKQRRPEIVRIVLSGHTDSRNLMQSNAVAHQFISKPTDPLKLIPTIKRSCALRDQLMASPLTQKLLDVGGVPSMPQVFQKILLELESGEPDIKRVGDLIGQDMGLSTKVLQLVNSAFMGLRTHVSDVTHACALLGLEHVKYLVLMAEIFDSGTSRKISKNVDLEALRMHSMFVGALAKGIVENEGAPKRIADDAFTAGLLHEIGQLVLAGELPDEYNAAHSLSKEKNISLLKAEKELFGASHAAIGGYLLELWGLPDPVVEAITYFDFPAGVQEELYDEEEKDAITPLAALHMAYYFATEQKALKEKHGVFELDTYFLEQHGWLDKVESWWDLCARQT